MKKRLTRSDHAKEIALKTVKEVVLVLWALTMLIPLVYMVVSSGKSAGAITAEPFSLRMSWEEMVKNYTGVWRGELTRPSGLVLQMFTPYLTMLRNAVILVAVALVFLVLGAVPIGYALARRSFRLKSAYMIFLVFILAVPLFGYLIAFYFMMSAIRFTNNLFGIGIVYAAVSMPSGIIFLRGFYANFPQEVEESAEIDGAGELRRFFSIVVPMSRGIIVSIVLVNFMGYWNEFGIASILIDEQQFKTISLNIMMTSEASAYDPGFTFALLTLSAIPTMLFFTVFQKQISQGGIAMGSLKG